MQKEFDLNENEPEVKEHFHMTGFERRLLLTQEQEATQKWPATLSTRKTQGESHLGSSL